MAEARSPSATAAATQQARVLAAALNVIEERLAVLGPNAGPEAIAEALAEPVRMFDLAAQRLAAGGA